MTKLIQFAPKPDGWDEIYSYYRTYNGKRVWVIFNRVNRTQTIDLAHYSQAFQGFSKGYEVLEDKKIQLEDKLEIKGKSVMVIEFNP